MNRNQQDSIKIGFEFSSSFLLRHVEVVYLDCSLWGIGLSAISIYSSNLFPVFLTAASTSIGMLSLTENNDQHCASLRNISIPLQPIISTSLYFIEFNLGGSSVSSVNWLHLAEIRFSDLALNNSIIPTTSSKHKFYH